ncbi:uncharacterized protein LOC105663231 [Megachile rotundata]|uniref:uncharacterized protein LOC105663231 n=1 Tax=Megachile rotundata TaxID=143995 RepID=UPI003FD2FA2E
MIEVAHEFDEEMSSIRLMTCENCKRCYPDIINAGFDFCTICSDPNKLSRFTSANFMDPGEVPQELVGLTYIEQMLIARIHPVVSLYKIRGAQYAYTGNVINFRQDISRLAKDLPHRPSDLPSTIVFNRDTSRGFVKFRASASKLRTALIWLKANNPFYADITISENNLSVIPENGDISGQLAQLTVDSTEQNDDNEESNIDDSYIPLLHHLDQEAVLNREIHMRYPSTESEPINEFPTEGYVIIAFPTLFPYGTCDLLNPNRREVSFDCYFKYLMLYKDGRFAKDARFRFFAMNTVLRRFAIQRSNIFIRNHGLGRLSLSDIRQRVRNNPAFLNQIMVYCSSLRSTKPYWRLRFSELSAMVNQLGLPTIFFTLSAADYHWPDLFSLLAPGTDPASLSERQRRDLMHENPLLVAYFFQRSCDVFIKKVLRPVFKVADYWSRFQWQWRGSPHIHGLLWLKDAPSIDEMRLTESLALRIKEYFDNKVLAINPFRSLPPASVHPSRKRFSDIDNENLNTDLGHLINKFQRHTRCD